jgi:hypothetical protein
MFKAACADLIPPEVAARPKQTFQAPMLSWVRGSLGSWVQEQLAAAPEPLRAFGRSPQTSHEAYRLWAAALIEAWRAAFDLEY